MEVDQIFSTEDINQQSSRILNFPVFKSSLILSRFLVYVIAETMHKKELQIKEYSIAVHVLGRSQDFNPNRDSIVRIHAGRLRRALNDYYLTQGMYDPIIIQIPKGGYIPEFIASGIKESSVDKSLVASLKDHKPLVAIFPLKLTTHKEDIEELHSLLAGQLSEELLRFHDIAVIGYFSLDMKAKIEQNVLEAGRLAGADYIITGSLVSIGQHIRGLINLLVTATGEVLLCKCFDRNISPPDITDMQDDIFQNFIEFANGCYRTIIQKRKTCL